MIICLCSAVDVRQSTTITDFGSKDDRFFVGVRFSKMVFPRRALKRTTKMGCMGGVGGGFRV